MMSAREKNEQKKMNNQFQGGLEPEPLPLMDLCRRVIRQQVGRSAIEQGKLEALNLPKAIRDYLEYRDRR